MSIFTISMTRFAEKYSEQVSAFDYHEHPTKCPHCGAIIEAPHGDIINELLGGEFGCGHCLNRIDGEIIPYTIVEWFNEHAPTCDHIIDSGDHRRIGTRVHHVMPSKDRPHVWTDTLARRTYCEYRNEVVFVETSCDILDDYCAECFHHEM